jgi:ERCC4-related helicase
MFLLQQQQEIIRKDFGSGHLNVLFTTSVGSEGLDFRQCQFVLSFDRPDNVVTLVQVHHSRGQIVCFMTTGRALIKRTLQFFTVLRN